MIGKTTATTKTLARCWRLENKSAKTAQKIHESAGKGEGGEAKKDADEAARLGQEGDEGVGEVGLLHLHHGVDVDLFVELCYASVYTCVCVLAYAICVYYTPVPNKAVLYWPLAYPYARPAATDV